MMRYIALAIVLLVSVLAQAARADVPAEAERWHDPPWRAAVESQHSGLDLRFEISEVPQGFALSLAITNPGDRALRFSCPTHEVCDFTVLRFDELIWRYNHNRFFQQTPLEVRIEPGETVQYTGNWDGSSNRGVPLRVWMRVDAEARLMFEGAPVRLRICNVSPRGRMTFVAEPGADPVSAGRTVSQEDPEQYSAYADVPPDHWAYRAIESFCELGVLDGFPEDYFSGEQVLMRYDLARASALLFDAMREREIDASTDALLRALEAEFCDQRASDSTDLIWSDDPPDYYMYRLSKHEPYTEVPSEHWPYYALRSLGELGALDGYPEGFFGGERLLTRYEFAQAMVRLSHEMRERRSDARTIALMWALDGEFEDELQEMSDTFGWAEDAPDYWPAHAAPEPPPRHEEEVPYGHWAYASMERFGELGALARYPDDYFSSERPLTRGQLAKVVQHLFDWTRRHGWDAETDELLQALETEFYDQLSVDCEVALWTERPADDTHGSS